MLLERRQHHAMPAGSPEKQILTRLFLAQRRLRFVAGVNAGLLWFAAGSALAALGLLILWNWDRLPGPWQWAAQAGRPAEFLWLPLLLGFGGFVSRWLARPSARTTAYRLDQMRDSQERLLTAVDWIYSEKPRTAVSERLLRAAAAELADEARLRADLRRLERVPRRRLALMATLLFPLLLLFHLPPHVGLPDSAALWMGPNQVDRLAEELAKELEEAPELFKPQAKLQELLRRLETEGGQPEAEAKLAEALRQELQQTVDALKTMSEQHESARELLETLAQRAQQSQDLTEADKKALAELKKLLEGLGQKDALEKAQKAWEEGDLANAASQLEKLQKEAGQMAQELKEMAAQGRDAGETQPSPDSGQEFDETSEDPQTGQEFDEGQGDRHGVGPGNSPGDEGQGQGPADYGRGTTEQEQEGGPASGLRSRRESDRTSDRQEEFQNLHAPLRTEEETSQTRVQGQLDEDGPRQRTRKEGRGLATESADSVSGGATLRYRESAENALLREEIPAAHRDEVRRYFETLDR